MERGEPFSNSLPDKQSRANEGYDGIKVGLLNSWMLLLKKKKHEFFV